MCRIVFLSALSCVISVRLGQERELLKHLLKDYYKDAMPVVNASTPVVLRFGLSLISADVDIPRQKVRVSAWTDLEWNDAYLKWDPADFGGITTVGVPLKRIWTPDITIYGGRQHVELEETSKRAMVYYDGTVFYPPAMAIEAPCFMNFTGVTQHCHLKFGSWVYHARQVLGFQLDITNRSENVDMTNYKVINTEYTVKNIHTKRRVVKYTCCPEPYPDLTVFIEFKKNPDYSQQFAQFQGRRQAIVLTFLPILPN